MFFIIQFLGTNTYVKALINLVFKIARLVFGKVATHNLMRIGIGHAKNQTAPFLISQGSNIS